MGTTLEAELELAAKDCEVMADWLASPLAGVREKGAAEMRSRAARLRQRAAWVRELEGSANFKAFSLTGREVLRALTGPIPSAAPSPGTGTAAVPTTGTMEWQSCPTCGGPDFRVIPATHRRDCAACGDGVAFNEDGLCCQCGSDTVLVDVATDKPDPGPSPEPVKPPAKPTTPCSECGGVGCMFCGAPKPTTCGALANDGTACTRLPHPESPDYHTDGTEYCWIGGTGRTPAAGTAPKGEK